MNHTGKIEADIKIGDGLVTIKRRGVSEVTVARLLGIEHDQRGEPVVLWLDRMVHEAREEELGGWKVYGAVSTILRRDPPVAQPTR
jgi:hypothetical protein